MHDARDGDAAAFQVDDEQHVVPDEAMESEHLDREEVCRRNRAPMNPKKCAPTGAFPAFTRRLDAVLG